MTKHVMLFDLEAGGHHGEYLYHLVKYWLSHNKEQQFSVVVSPDFSSIHPEFVSLCQENENRGVKLVLISETENERFLTQTSLWRRALVEWEILNKYGRELEADVVVCMYIDRILLPLALQREVTFKITGIYFRPSFHYATCFSAHPQSVSDWLRAWRQRLIVALALRHRMLSTLFCLDWYAAKIMNKLTEADVIPLAEPVDQEQVSEDCVKQLQEQYGIDTKRKIFLLFGVLTERKGIHQLLDAIELLPADTCKATCFLLAGPLRDKKANSLKERLLRLKQYSHAQIILDDRLVAKSEVGRLFGLADIILAPYQRHVGMSAVIARAASAGKPILASNYGLIGHLVSQHRLGITLNVSSSEDLAETLNLLVRSSSTEKYFDPISATRFADLNTEQRFASTILADL